MAKTRKSLVFETALTSSKYLLGKELVLRDVEALAGELGVFGKGAILRVEDKSTLLQMQLVRHSLLLL